MDMITIALPNGTFWEIASFFILVIASGIAIFKWFHNHRRKQKRKIIRTTLVDLFEEGRQIKAKCYEKNIEAPTDEANKWAEKVFKYLETNLGSDYALRFDSHEGLPPGLTHLSGTQAKVESFIGSRLARLNQFLTELTNAN